MGNSKPAKLRFNACSFSRNFGTSPTRLPKMSDDQLLEFMAQVSGYMRSTDRRFEQISQQFEQTDRRFEQINQQFEQTNRQLGQLITVMHNGFERVTSQLSDLTEEVRSTNKRVDRLTDETSAIRRRVNATFDQAGQLTEQSEAATLRISHVEEAQQPTNAELHQRLLAVETKLNQAS